MRIEIEENGNDYNGPCLKIIAETKMDSFNLGVMFNEVIEKHKVDAKYSDYQEHVYIKIPILVDNPETSI